MSSAIPGVRALPKSLLDGLLALLCMGLFAFLYFSSLGDLGITSDDANVGATAWGFLHQVPVLMNHGAKLRWHGFQAPLTWTYKHGPVEFFLTVPFVWLLGHTVAAIRWRNAFLACVTVGATFALGLRLYRDRWTAFLACLLLAMSPVFVLFSIMGGHTAVTTAAAGIAGLWLLLLYADLREPRFAHWGLACLGLGLGCKSQFAAFMVGLLACGLIFRREAAALLPTSSAARRRLAGIGFCCLLLPSVPLAASLLFGTFRQEGLLSTWIAHAMIPEAGRSNADYWNNLCVRWGQLLELWELKVPGDLANFVRDAGAYRTPGQWSLAVGALGSAALGLLESQKGRSAPRRRWIPWIMAAAYLLVSPLSPSRLWTHHLFSLLPLLYLTACSAIAAAPSRLRPWALAAFLAFAAVRLRSTAAFFRGLRAETARTGGNHAEIFRAPLDLSDWFSRRPDRRPVFLGGDGTDGVLDYLSGGRLGSEVVEADQALTSAAWRGEWDRLLGDGAAAFVVDVTPDGAKFPFLTFKSEAAGRRVSVALADTIRRPDGDPVYEIYEVSGNGRVHQ